MAYENLLVEEQQGICTITLNRPEKRNALDTQTLSEIREAFRSIRTNQNILGVILTGAGGKAFASGADIRAIDLLPAGGVRPGPSEDKGRDEARRHGGGQSSDD